MMHSAGIGEGSEAVGAQAKADRVRRFTLFTILEHWSLVALFVLLLATGLAQKYYMFGASQWFIAELGGIDGLRGLHRAAGFGLLAFGLFHLASAVWVILMRGRQFSMLVGINDFEDAVHNFKYYIGMYSTPALCDRYNYKEKFVYWLVLVGCFQMSVTGVILRFPVWSASHLPGQFIPAAKAMHSNEAMMIFLLLAVWHIYDSIFNPDVFPLDTTIFSGYISRDRMLHEHPLELMRLEGATEDEIRLARFGGGGGPAPKGGDKAGGAAPECQP